MFETLLLLASVNNDDIIEVTTEGKTDNNEEYKKISKSKDKRWFIAGTICGGLTILGSMLAYNPNSMLPEEFELFAQIAGGIGLSIGLFGLAIITNKRLLYNVSLTYTLFTNFKNSNKHWDSVTDGIVLGAIPLSKHKDTLVNEEGITGILTLLESFEIEKGILYAPVQPKEWDAVNVENKWIKTLDYEPVSPKMLEDGADFIHEHLSKDNNNKIYVHCKAGRGRSTACVITYLCKYKNMKVDEAWKLVKEKRSQINLNTRQYKSVELTCKKFT
eukprot:TRINITY_DN310_c0_g3_i1.p1 TRINITY_DN310_c0_g3~~TRINITY_DN310_c0_g3_i1.p1  ORF type:complete len:274 (-),score=94.90 TRINITY_DN310_c0_g3_i1:145-966(-)